MTHYKLTIVDGEDEAGFHTDAEEVEELTGGDGVGITFYDVDGDRVLSARVPNDQSYVVEVVDR